MIDTAQQHGIARDVRRGPEHFLHRIPAEQFVLRSRFDDECRAVFVEQEHLAIGRPRRGPECSRTRNAFLRVRRLAGLRIVTTEPNPTIGVMSKSEPNMIDVRILIPPEMSSTMSVYS